MVQLEFMKILINAGIGNYDLSRYRYTLYLYIQQKSVDASTLQAEMCEIKHSNGDTYTTRISSNNDRNIFSEKYQEINISVSF